MTRKLLVANRGEIAVRILRSAAESGISCVALFAQDDQNALQVRLSDEAAPLAGSGARAYLDIDDILRIATEKNCDAIHPGYGFLSENAQFAAKCEAAGLRFVGPTPEQLTLLGDKATARQLAQRCSVPVLKGTDGPTSLKEARDFFDREVAGAVMLKAVAGGGGRGIRRVEDPADLEAAYSACRSEAERAFGNGDLYVEVSVPRARHIEVQIIGDGHGGISHLWDRECSLQRRHQKIIEIAPAPGLANSLRQQILDAAVAMAKKISIRNLATFEFLVDVSEGNAGRFYFLEANPRIQVEHTVTEEVLGLDLVLLQLEISNGKTLKKLGLAQESVPNPRGICVQARVNMETIRPDGSVHPASGTLLVYEPPSGIGIRVDGLGYTGYRTSANYDSLLAKVIVHTHSDDISQAFRKTARALAEFRIDGVATNLSYLQRILALREIQDGLFHTRFLEDNNAALAEHLRDDSTSKQIQLLSAVADKSDPLAILAHGQTGGVRRDDTSGGEPPTPEGTVAVRAPLTGTVISIAASIGDIVVTNKPLLVMDAMKMEHVVAGNQTGILRGLTVNPGDAVSEGTILAFVEPREIEQAEALADALQDPDFIRPDLAEVHRRQSLLTDEMRAGAAERRHRTGQRTMRENIADLCDSGSFVEFGGLTVAARRTRNSLDELILSTPADGMIMGTARVNGENFPDARARCAVMAYDPTVMAGTQGLKGHEKLDRMLELAKKQRLPIVFFTEGGGGRPGDTDKQGIGYNFIQTFSFLGRLSGLVPTIGITNGRCFAGNAFIFGCCDVTIATKNSIIGIGGPAVIEGAGLGAYKAEEVGPVSMQYPNGTIDILVDDEAAAVAAAKKYLSYFQGPVSDWSCADQRELRAIVPENRRRAYEMRKLIHTLADTNSVLELRGGFGAGIITALIRIEGRPMGVLANNPHYLGGAIDAPAGDKAARFMQLCEAFDLPILSLVDTPGNMVGPDAERVALIRHCARMVVIGSNLTVPWVTMVIRKGYGLGGLAMAGGSFSNSIMAAAWPTGEFGGMPMEGFVKLGFRDQLAAIADVDARKAKYEQMVADMYESGKALSAATFFEFDDVIDPRDTRFRVVEALRAAPPTPLRSAKKLRWIDTW